MRLAPMVLSGYREGLNQQEIINGLDNSDACGDLHRPGDQRLSAGWVL